MHPFRNGSLAHSSAVHLLSHKSRNNLTKGMTPPQTAIDLLNFDHQLGRKELGCQLARFESQNQHFTRFLPFLGNFYFACLIQSDHRAGYFTSVYLKVLIQYSHSHPGTLCVVNEYSQRDY